MDCRLILRGVATSEPSDSARIVTVKENEFGDANKVMIPTSITGKFINTTDFVTFDYDFDLKSTCFYIDWDQTNKTWAYGIATDPKLLQKKIKSFENTLVKFNFMG